MVFATVTPGLDVEVTANRSDEEPGRLIRLERILGYVHGLACHYGNSDLLDKVVSVHDHKGDLTVVWREKPADGEMEFFNKAWRDGIIGDDWGPIEHNSEDGQTIATCNGPGMDYASGSVSLHLQK